jgi:tetratricopeptide (TPR) repeat protein
MMASINMTRFATQHIAYSVYFLITLLAVLCYYPGLSGDYMFDDRPNLLDNDRLDIKSLDLNSLEAAAYSSGAGLLRRPVSMLSFALNRYFFGMAPYSYKTINLVIHLLTGFCLFLLSRLIVKSYQEFRSPSLSDSVAIWLPVIVGGLWLLHPLNLTSVLYIVQRMTSLATLFTVCGLCLYVIGRHRMLSGQAGMQLILLGLTIFGGLALLSKETGALLPLYMVIVEITLFRFRNSKGNFDRNIAAFFFLLLVIPAGLFTAYIINNPNFLNYSARDFTLVERLLTEARVLVFYLKMVVMPSITELGLYHDDIAISRHLLDPPSTLYSLLILSGLLLTALLLLNKRPLASLGILWFFAGHAIESTIFPLEIAHEHRNYLADFGILLTITSVVAQAPLCRLTPAIQTAVPALLLLLFFSTTWLRAEQWSDNINHAVYEARHHPNSARAVGAAGRIHARLALAGHQQSADKAYAYLERAAELDRGGILPEMTMIKLSYLLDKPHNPEWYQQMLYKLDTHPVTSSDLTSLQELAECIGNYCKMSPEMMDSLFQAALKNESGELLTIYGYYRINMMGDFIGGLNLFSRAVELSPHESQYWINLIDLLTTMKNFDGAEQKLALFKEAKTRPGNENDYRKLQQKIDYERKAHTSSIQIVNPENS